MAKFKPVSSQVNFAQNEEELINFWKENKIFEKSLESRPQDKKWTFLDGPPFVTGTPHYGSLLSSIPKDVFGRYWTMKGYRVRRVWGWDGHGLPIENKVENKLKIKRKKDIEESVGVKKFIEECLGYVNQVSSEWEWYIDHIGRWVDFKNAYKTWDLPYMESVMWVFKQMYDKDLIYKGLRVSLYCPHCSTPISNFEVAMDADNYKDISEPTAVFKYPLKDEKNTFLLAWSTTPWNKLVTPALAINPKLNYVKVKQGEEFYILAKGTLKMLDGKFEKIEEFRGKKLLGKEFIPHYNFYKINPGKKAFIVVGDEFVTEEEGTGVVTLAVYGEEDLKVMQRENIQLVMHLDEEGTIEDYVPNFGGLNYLEANDKVLQDLNSRRLIYKTDSYTHSVPFCWRCATRLYYAPKDAWFVNIQKIKQRLFKNNEAINWFPKHFKYGRFAKSMEAAPDWNISRNRYWGSPVPVWECGCGERFVPGSIKELEELSGKKITNLHKPDIDEVKIKCSKCGQIASRVPEVLDSWIEAGSASFAERHFPFKEGVKLEDFFPPDFIAEYTGQIRAWFYVLHVLGTALFDSPAFKNVLVEGVMLGIDGRKMSKNYNNYPDPKGLMQQYGGDALRLYLLGSPIMKGEDVNFSNDGVPEVTRGFMLILWNSYKYFIDYANTFGWEKSGPENLNILDRWILSKLVKVTSDVTKNYEKYDTFTVVKLLREFIVNDLSTWYIRRSRDRISGENAAERNTALSILYEVLVTYAKLLAPLAPFISEEIFRNLTGGESVHLAEFPKEEKSAPDEELIRGMVLIRKIAEMGLAKRKEAGIKLRQPLAQVLYKSPERLSGELEVILAAELNVKKVGYEKSSKEEPQVILETSLTQELKEEGEARDLIRQIQQLRKEQGLTLADKTKIITPSYPDAFESQILQGTTSVSIEKGPELKVSKV
ncbi:MAG: Isoleucine-tRNA ligase [Candidatus Daviesbacteria bacterium GW2011_GWB1_39_5]|uniref:Isoleucine--tRNA ligase n=1 Tax=Candidatus Daviesbacteria bacterium GW2011_GWC2_40_12 TaxID=1618431 RepID=A0A0G0T6H8_9BACT|nr:MAG: Isoleucine-tRNA ligase [Candidatus Daviesbacteria bacterium GW2011_GWA2_39_33]KKR24323.1 MAG: Isoleucine-tRNA ligase [Candidatus Daviesbacteria bacterium GW2011_GWB1_39_5]KKR42740.1 MAG: Isoleucine-tRNA ligase [Candidatus Daviesbacteria bacterium GW2011_GWC2_40_12]OGE21411.1 MAG: isoleucine--tRNA ligase [Candidatus Daviesbacteria bacterium RIFCSPHIGHO2_01_FULL_40_24]OGE30072.1 MAG: isoleucine--tRNA ligase [Candidatus Daviesbacteria bacterium RIFCSPHIGHO2_02_FULL_40_16]OGE43493.1 MAG: i